MSRPSNAPISATLPKPRFGQRRSMRLPDYDYSIAGSFFVTICARDRAAIFGSLRERRFYPNALGRIVESCWEEIPAHSPTVTLDEWVLMPNHLHGIVVNWGDKGATCRAPADPRSPSAAFPPVVKNAEQPNKFGPLVANSLGSVVRAFKAAATKTARDSGAWSIGTIWQRGYHERLIRNARELEDRHGYIRENPLKWATDHERLW